MSETTLITGSEGFIGRLLSERLKALGQTVGPFSRSLGNDLAADSPFQSYLQSGIKTVFHLAAISSSPASWEDPHSYYRINTLGTQKVVDFCRKTGARLIYVSTYVYGSPRYLPVDETHPALPNNPYAHSKWLGEEICRFYAKNFGVSAVILRPFNIYGPGQSGNFLIPSIIRQWLAQREVTVENLLPKRDFLFVDDFIDACVSVSKLHNPACEIYNTGSGLSLSVNDVINTLEKVVGRKILRHSRKHERQGEIAEVVARCRLTEEGLWKPAISFEQGLSLVLKDPFERR